MHFFPARSRAGPKSKEVELWIISTSRVGVCGVGARERDEWERIKSTGDRVISQIHQVWEPGLGGKEERLGEGCLTEREGIHPGAGHVSEVKEKVDWE